MTVTKILVPIDFSEHSEAALEHAIEIAKAFGAECVLHHVVEAALYPVAYGMAPVSSVNFEEDAKNNAQEAMQPLLDKISAAGVKASSFIETGMASLRICETAQRDGFDLIVIATHGLTGLAHLLMGSTAERVVRHASCPVLSVKVDVGG